MVSEQDVEAELPLDHAGARLLRAREAAGMSRAQVAAETKIPERHLVAIEEGNYAALPARTYAVGFSRSYAKAVGANEAEIVAAVREDLADQALEPAHRGVPAFEPGDPGRVPSSSIAWLAALLALAAVVAGLYFGWKSYFAPAGALPSILAEETPAPVAPASAAAVAPSPSGPVVFTATKPDIWVKFYDPSGSQLLQKQLAQGESYTIPPDLPQVLLWTARPEALAITIGGQPVAPLSPVQVMMKDVPVTAAALLARQAPGAASQAASPPATTPQGAALPPRPAVRQTPAVAPAATTAAATPQPAPVAASPSTAAVSANQAAER